MRSVLSKLFNTGRRSRGPIPCSFPLFLFIMEPRERKDPAGEDLLFQLTVKQPVRFKAGAELQGTVELTVDVSASDSDHCCSVTIHLNGATHV